MKIQGTRPTAIIDSQPRSRQRTPARQGSGVSDTVQISKVGDYIADLRAEAAQGSGIREDVVAEVQRQLADGTLEGSIDLDLVVDRLLGDL